MEKTKKKTTSHKLPVASGRGESGRESVGDGVPTAKLLLLLLRELREEGNKTEEKKICLCNAISKHHYPTHVPFISVVNSHVR